MTTIETTIPKHVVDENFRTEHGIVYTKNGVKLSDLQGQDLSKSRCASEVRHSRRNPYIKTRKELKQAPSLWKWSNEY